MEDLVVVRRNCVFSGLYKNRRVLLTGHTGFKGSWLALWLSSLGAKVVGLSLDPPTSPNHWDLLGLPVKDLRGDVRDFNRVAQVIDEFSPEVVFHLAAQPLVRRSYRDPLLTWSTNVMGTVNVLEACRRAPSVAAIVVITTDKVYANQDSPTGYRETDRLGGHDPYSASKACCEIAADCFRSAYFEPEQRCLLATVRAGNVFGGGDWSEDRLIPDLVRAVTSGATLEIRSPNATRPWQHVLESLCGYLLVGSKLLTRQGEFATAFNIGPSTGDNRRVIDILDELKVYWPQLTYCISTSANYHESSELSLDSSLARSMLHWQSVWPLKIALALTAKWYQSHYASRPIESYGQLDEFVAAAHAAGHEWAR